MEKTIIEVLTEVTASMRSAGKGFDDKVTIELSPSDLLTILVFFLSMPFGGVSPDIPFHTYGMMNAYKEWKNTSMEAEKKECSCDRCMP